jgi:predicted CoA-substrate-specific enzyme activase
MYSLGIDIGSAATKAVILEDGARIVHMTKMNMGTGTSAGGRVFDAVLSESGLSMKDIGLTVATGYGRNRFERADKQISELSCHARGVAWRLPGIRTIIDIGGQDVKAILLDEKGKMVNFVMNEKCAAGTGRFLEVMAGVMETTVDRLDELDSRSKVELTISSTCTVFAESEVISRLSEGMNIEDIAQAIHNSVAKRVCGLAKRVGLVTPIALTGGVAQNGGVVRALQREIGQYISVCEAPQMTGAIGAALIAFDVDNGNWT